MSCVPVSMQASPKLLWTVVYTVGGSVLSHGGLEPLWVRFVLDCWRAHATYLCVCACVCLPVKEGGR